MTIDSCSYNIEKDFLYMVHELSIHLNSVDDMEEALERFFELILEIDEIDCCWTYVVDEFSGGVKIGNS